MDGVKLIARNEAAVVEALTRGQVQHLDTASEEITDEFLLFLRFGIHSTKIECLGCLKKTDQKSGERM